MDFPEVVLLAFIDSEFDDAAVVALELAVADLRRRRDWAIAPPEFVDVEEEGVRTVGVQLGLRSVVSPVGQELPVEIDRAHFEDVRTVVEALGPVSEQHAIDIGFELDGVAVGWLTRGQPDEMLTTGLLGEWDARLVQRGG